MQGIGWVQKAFSVSRSSLTSCICSSQQFLPRQVYTSPCTEQHQAVRGDLPGTWFNLFRLLQDMDMDMDDGLAGYGYGFEKSSLA